MFLITSALDHRVIVDQVKPVSFGYWGDYVQGGTIYRGEGGGLYMEVIHVVAPCKRIHEGPGFWILAS